jgi:hypothetical protein
MDEQLSTEVVVQLREILKERMRPKPPHKPEVYGLVTRTPRELMVMTYDGPEVRWILLQPPMNPMAPGETFPTEPFFSKVFRNG